MLYIFLCRPFLYPGSILGPGRKEWFFILAVIHTQAGDEWRNALKLPNGELTERVQSDDVERNFWRMRQQNSTAALDAYRLPVCSALRALITSYKIRSVMELGPGWGNYTFFLAEQGIRLTCVDISPDNLDYLARELKTRMGVSAKMICAPWENAQIEPNGNDMVFAYNCFYRMRDIEKCLLKLNLAATKLCVMGMNRPPELPWLPAMENDLGLKIRYTRMGCEQFQKVLSQLGINAELINIENKREYHYDSIGALMARAQQHIRSDFNEDALKKLLAGYHHAMPDGSLVCEYHFLSQLLVWEPKAL